jgi:ribosomal protein L14E/L6E/L27E
MKETNALPATPEPRTGMFETADVVISLNGRDEGKPFLVVGTEDEYSLLADGKSRKIGKPKRKNNKHLKLEEKINNPIAGKLISGGKVTNNEIRRALAQYTEDRGERGGT